MGVFPILVLLAAAPGSTPAPLDSEKSRLAVSVGEFAVLDDPSFLEVGVEWRFPEWRYHLRPVVGGIWFDGPGEYGYGGLRMEIPLFESGYVAAGLAAGLYNQEDVDLSGPVNFRSSLEIGWKFAKNASLGITFYHLSNASLEDPNPGSESVVLTLSFVPAD